MPYCSSEGKFAGFDEHECEVESEDINGLEVEVTVHCMRPCSSCGSEAATYDFELSAEVECPTCGTTTNTCEDCDGTGAVPDPGDASKTEECSTCNGEGTVDEETDIEFTLDSVEAEPTDRTQTVDRNGKPIKNYRYQKRFLGVSVTASLTCGCCNEEFTVEMSDEAPASYWETESSH